MGIVIVLAFYLGGMVGVVGLAACEARRRGIPEELQVLPLYRVLLIALIAVLAWPAFLVLLWQQQAQLALQDAEDANCEEIARAWRERHGYEDDS